jgi:hypothetical protein
MIKILLLLFLIATVYCECDPLQAVSNGVGGDVKGTVGSIGDCVLDGTPRDCITGDCGAQAGTRLIRDY